LPNRHLFSSSIYLKHVPDLYPYYILPLWERIEVRVILRSDALTLPSPRGRELKQIP